jgi:phenylacetate-CoA ligase
MTLKVERGHHIGRDRDAQTAKGIGKEIKKQIFVTADVEIVDYGSLPRSERKSKRVYDNRE